MLCIILEIEIDIKWKTYTNVLMIRLTIEKSKRTLMNCDKINSRIDS